MSNMFGNRTPSLQVVWSSFHPGSQLSSVSPFRQTHSQVDSCRTLLGPQRASRPESSASGSHAEEKKVKGQRLLGFHSPDGNPRILIAHTLSHRKLCSINKLRRFIIRKIKGGAFQIITFAAYQHHHHHHHHHHQVVVVEYLHFSQTSGPQTEACPMLLEFSSLVLKNTL